MTHDNMPTQATRVQGFANFFKTYISAFTVIIAALPVPITQANLIPTFLFQRGPLSTYTSLFCFLFAALIFFYRHSFARWMFAGYLESIRDQRTDVVDIDRTERARARERWARGFPLLLILTSVGCVFLYQYTLDASVEDVWYHSGAMPYDEVLNQSDPQEVPYQYWLIISYVGIFLTAEAAFLLMALKEYLQDLISVRDSELIDPELERHLANEQSTNPANPE
jgi:hypothetical protein